MLLYRHASRIYAVLIQTRLNRRGPRNAYVYAGWNVQEVLNFLLNLLSWRGSTGEKRGWKQRIRGVTSRGRVAVARRCSLGGGEGVEEKARSADVLGSHRGFVLRETVPIVALKYRARLIQDVTSRCDNAIYVTRNYRYGGTNLYILRSRAQAGSSTTSVRSVRCKRFTFSHATTRAGGDRNYYFFLYNDNFN